MSDEYTPNLDAHKNPYSERQRTVFPPLIPIKKTLSDSRAEITIPPHSTNQQLDWRALDEFQ